MQDSANEDKAKNESIVSRSDSILSISEHDQTKTLNLLEDYLKRYVLNNTSYKIPKNQLILMFMAGLLGAAWGLPWRQAAENAAIIFPKGLARDIFKKIFSAGIVITVGGDGLWIMLEIGKAVSSKSFDETRLTAKKQQGTCIKISKIVFPALFALFSCISAVYATDKYNTGLNKFLGIITFIGNYGYGLYGYTKFIERLSESISNLRNTDPQYKDLLAVRDKLSEKLQALLKNKQDINLYSDPQQEFLQNLLTTQPQKNSSSPSNDYFKKAFQLFFLALIPTTSSAISFFLTKEFLEKNIYNSSAFAVTATLFSEIPGFVVSSISTYSVFGKLFDILFCHGTSDPKEVLARQIYCLSTVLPALILLISLTAPSAGSYITYNTLAQEGVNKYLQWIATSSIIAARIIFSNFTLNKLATEFLLKIYEKTHDQSPYNKKIRLERFANTLSNTNPGFFKPFLAKSTDSIKNQTSMDDTGHGKDEKEDTPLIPKKRPRHFPCGII